jgi:hypothetical protein
VDDEGDAESGVLDLSNLDLRALRALPLSSFSVWLRRSIEGDLAAGDDYTGFQSQI